MLSVLCQLMLLRTGDQEGARSGVGADKVQVGTAEDRGAPRQVGAKGNLGTGQLKGLTNGIQSWPTLWKEWDRLLHRPSAGAVMVFWVYGGTGSKSTEALREPLT